MVLGMGGENTKDQKCLWEEWQDGSCHICGMGWHTCLIIRVHHVNVEMLRIQLKELREDFASSDVCIRAETFSKQRQRLPGLCVHEKGI